MSAKLSPDQKQQIARWVNEGLSLSDVQKRIAADFGVSMTYMDVRFLVDDLDVTVKDKEQPKAPEPAKTAAAPQEPAASAAYAGAPGDFVDAAPTPPGLAPEAPAPAAAGKVRVTIDPIQKPGVLVGGSVTFSDGQSGVWQMDQYGQLGFVPPFPGYKPAPADVQQFQVVLDQELRKLGY